jgi:hemerythrin-like domain-containing protein
MTSQFDDTDVTDFFEHDHRQLDESFEEYQRLKNQDFEAARDHFQTFYDELVRHIDWEEDALFPAFEEEFGEGLTGTMRREHDQIEDVLEEIKALLEDGSVPDDETDRRLLKFLEPHNDNEETVVYPAIDRHLSDEKIERIFEEMNHSP